MNCVLLLLDSPENLQFGIDNSQWILGKKFKGIQGIPYGTHYAHYSLKEEGYQFKQGFFFISSPESKIIIKSWNTELQQFLTFKDCTPYIYAVEMHDFDLYLGVYPMDKFELWSSCVQYIKKPVLDKLDPIKNVTIEEYDDSDLGSNTPLHTTIYYTDIPKIKSQYTGEQLTAINFDKSQIVKDLIAKEYNNDYTLFLGELQYSFVKFLLGEHYESFNQWKQLIILITSCDKLIEEETQLFIDFIPTFYHQLQQLPQDFFIDPISSNNFLQSCIKNVLELAQVDNPSPLRKKLIVRCDRLRQLCEQKFLMNVCKEDDDDEPVLVEDFNFVQL